MIASYSVPSHLIVFYLYTLMTRWPLAICGSGCGPMTRVDGYIVKYKGMKVRGIRVSGCGGYGYKDEGIGILLDSITLGYICVRMVPAPQKHITQAWSLLLKELLNIQEEIYTPAHMASGQKGLANKVGVMAYQWHIAIPAHIPLRQHAGSIAVHCSDMGHEMSAPEFSTPCHDSLLPEWVDRGDINDDLSMPDKVWVFVTLHGWPFDS